MEDVVPARSVDFRNSGNVKPFVPPRPTPVVPTASPIERRREFRSRTLQYTKSNLVMISAVHLTTEYVPRDRPPPSGSIPPPSSNAKAVKATPTREETPVMDANLNQVQVEAPTVVVPEPIHPGEEVAARSDDPPSKPADPALLNLPPARAAASAPQIDATAPGMLPNRTSVYEIDMDSLADKNWRRPGSDLSDWFNYGFDEISWEAYCVRRRELGEAAAMLKGAVLVSRIKTTLLL